MSEPQNFHKCDHSVFLCLTHFPYIKMQGFVAPSDILGRD